MFNDNDDLNEQELAALAAVPRKMAPSDLLEERVVRALRSEGQTDGGHRCCHDSCGFNIAA